MGESLTCPHPDCRQPLPPLGAQQPHPFHCPRCGRLVQVQPAQVTAETLDLPEQRTALTLDLPATPPQRLNGPALVTLDLPPAGPPAPDLPADLPADAKPETLALDPHTLQPPAVPAADRSPRLPADAPAVIGRYQILDFLGEGGFGRVYLAHDTRLDRRVALKVSRSDRKDDSKQMQLLLDEARAAAKFRHPNIVAVFDSGQFRDPQSASQQTLYYIASAFIEGQALDKRLQQLPKGQTLDFRTTAQLVRKVAEALAYAHRRKIVHRDVKPGNIMLDEQGEPLLMDFGLAALHEEGQAAQQKQKPSGTPPYMSPEQWQGEAVPASDQYSLGCTLYQLLTGELLFAAGSSDHFRFLHETEPLARIVNPRVPPDLEAITRKCLEKEPKRRYATCQEFADDMRRFLDGEPVQARPLGMRERLVKWARREPRVAGLTAAVAVALLLGTCVATVLGLIALDRAALASAKEELANEKAADAQREARRAKVGRHGFQMTAAWQAWQQHDIATAETILDEVSPEFQGTWEYHHVRNLCRRKAMGLKGHTGDVNSVAYNPDGSRIVSGSDDSTLKVWNARTGQDLFTLKGHTQRVNSVAYSPDGKRIVSGSADNTLKIWDAQTGQNLLTLKGHTNSVMSVAYSPDGSRIVSGSADKTLKVWDAQTGHALLTLESHKGRVSGVAYNPDGSRIVSGSQDKTLKVWDARSGQNLLTFSNMGWWVMSVAYSPDGSRIVSDSADKTLKVRDSRTGQVLLTLKGHKGRVSSVGYSPDGSRIVSGSVDSTLKVWDARSGQELFTLKGHRLPGSTSEGSMVICVAYSPDGSRIASGGSDYLLRGWDTQTSQDLFTLSHPGKVTCVAYSPDSRRIVSGSDDNLKVRDARTGQDLLTLKGHTNWVISVAYSPDGSRIASGSFDNTLKVWDAATGQNLLTLDAHTDRAVWSVAYSPDGSRIASGGFDNTLKVWDAATGQNLLTLKGHKDRVFSVGYSPDGSRIVSGSVDSTLKVWDARTGQDLFTLKGHTQCVNSVAYSPDGKRIVSGSADKTLKLWDAQTGQDLLTLKGHMGFVHTVAVSRDGSRIASGSGDKTLKLWDAQTGQDLFTLQGHSAEVNSVGYSPDGSRIVSGSDVVLGNLHDDRYEMELKVWDADAHGSAIRIEHILTPDQLMEEEQTQRILSARSAHVFHTVQAETAENTRHPFATVFHLDRLLALSPEDRPVLLERRTTILRVALKSNRDGQWAARAFAHQAIADPATVPELKPLLLALSRHQDVVCDRLYGALLLRTGNARDAAPVLRAAIRQRPPDTPPIDELLLAVALARLDRRDEAREYLGSAVAWMDRCDQPLRAASLAGFAAGNPLAALGAIAHTLSDPRLNRLDPFTTHELRTLRAEAEKALGQP